MNNSQINYKFKTNPETPKTYVWLVRASLKVTYIDNSFNKHVETYSSRHVGPLIIYKRGPIIIKILVYIQELNKFSLFLIIVYITQ